MPLHLIKITASVLHKISEIVTINFLFISYTFDFETYAYKGKEARTLFEFCLFVFAYTEYFLCVTKNSG